MKFRMERLAVELAKDASDIYGRTNQNPNVGGLIAVNCSVSEIPNAKLTPRRFRALPVIETAC